MVSHLPQQPAGMQHVGGQHQLFPRGWIGRGGGKSKLQIPLLVGSGVTAQQPLVNVTCQHTGMAEEVSGQDGALFWNQLVLWPGVLEHLLLARVAGCFYLQQFYMACIISLRCTSLNCEVTSLPGVVPTCYLFIYCCALL